jgi:mRNA interferase RelE/StbE
LGYEVVWHEQVLKDLKALGREDSARVVAKVKTELAEDPVGSGKPLSGIFKGLMRYRIGAHRVIYAVDHEARRIRILYVKPRAEAYRRRGRAA